MTVHTDGHDGHTWQHTGLDNILWTRLVHPAVTHANAQRHWDPDTHEILCITETCHLCGDVRAKLYTGGPWRCVVTDRCPTCCVPFILPPASDDCPVPEQHAARLGRLLGLARCPEGHPVTAGGCALSACVHVRDHAVPCSRCRRDTRNASALCDACEEVLPVTQ